MNAALKSAALSAASALSLLYRLVPQRLRRLLVTGLLAVDSRIGAPDEGLRRLFRVQDDLERLINERAMALGRGEHPKHRLRLPLFERTSQVPMRRELGIGYFSDPTPVIEPTLEEFEREMRDAGLEIAEKSVLWGEIWAECRPKEP